MQKYENCACVFQITEPREICQTFVQLKDGTHAWSETLLNISYTFYCFTQQIVIRIILPKSRPTDVINFAQQLYLIGGQNTWPTFTPLLAK